MTGALQDHTLAGMLVCQQVRGGLELVLGLHRDPEMGLVVMAGARRRAARTDQGRGVLRAAGEPRQGARHARRTRAARLIEGYRGSEPRDVGAVIDALVGLGRLAIDLPDVIESVDINPFVGLADRAAWRSMR